MKHFSEYDILPEYADDDPTFAESVVALQKELEEDMADLPTINKMLQVIGASTADLSAPTIEKLKSVIGDVLGEVMETPRGQL